MTASGLMSSLPAELVDRLGLRLSTRRARRPGLVADGPTYPTHGMHPASYIGGAGANKDGLQAQPAARRRVGVLESKDQAN